MKYIAFLRAINVGGHTVKMDRLRQLFEEMGFRQVESFIASGNLIFESEEKDSQSLERQIETALKAALGYAVVTFLRTPAEVAQVAAARPLPDIENEGNTLYIGFLAASPSDQAIAKLVALTTEIDSFAVAGREVYWLSRKTMSQSPISGAILEKTLGQAATFRNATTVRKVAAKYN